MPRSIPEWIGKRDDTAIPPRVRDRVLSRFSNICQCGCRREIRPFDEWQVDHAIALINGGENRENNLVPLLAVCHKAKTARDVKEKAKVYRIRAKHRGIKLRKKGRSLSHPFLRRKMDGTVVPK